MLGAEWLLVAAPLVWLGAVTAQQTRRWLRLRRPADWQAAEARAQALLRDTLSPAEQRALASVGYLDIPSKLVAGRHYRLYRQPRTVEVYERGRRVQALCVQPTSYLPPSDRLLLQKLMLEADEARYLRLANVFRYRRLEFPPGAASAARVTSVRLLR